MEAHKLEQIFSAKCWEAYIEPLPIGVALVGKDGKWLKVNHAACLITGYTASELTSGKTWMDITVPEDAVWDQKEVDRLQKDPHETYSMYKRYITKMGSLVHVIINPSNLLDEEGRILCHYVPIVEVPGSGSKMVIKTTDEGSTHSVVRSKTLTEFVKDLDFKTILSICAGIGAAIGGILYALLTK